jgi:hypothetical protein
MNRIILIGNGFDLAHGLKTSYRDFINDFWQNIIVEYNTKISNTPFYDTRITKFFNTDFLSIDAEAHRCFPNIQDYISFKNNLENYGIRIQFNNRFLRDISENLSINNWVDIEEEYYKRLLSIMRNFIQKQPHQKYLITHLNADFQKIKDQLSAYLKKISATEVDIKDEITKKIYSKIKLQDLSAKGVELFIKEKVFEHEMMMKILEEIKNNPDRTFELDYPVDMREFLGWEKRYDTNHAPFNPLFKREVNLQDKIREILNENSQNTFLTYPKKTLFLNFNYTNTDKQYINIPKPNLSTKLIPHDFSTNYGIEKESIHIHGELDSLDNPIIFGYGDELGEEYAAIEKLNDNNYLENVKSIMYSETDNYKRLLGFINSDAYQVFIFGHSCGISDRTLLNTLFEHDNCVSIKPFFYKKEDGTDNYSELTKNISRNFTNKILMREKVVNKNYCELILN